MYENMVILEALKTRMNQGMDPGLYFYRDANQKEIDLVYKKRDELLPVEIKAAMTYSQSLHNSLTYFTKISGINKGYLIYAGDLEFEKSGISVLNFTNTYSLFE